MSDRQERERRAMEEEIVATAVALVRAEGAANLSLRAVAKQMDYSSAALYRYFDDKAALVTEICRRGFGELRRHLLETPADLPPVERLVRLGEAYLRFAAAEPHLYTLMFVDVLPAPVDALPPSLADLTGDVAFGLLYQHIADGAAAGAFRLSPEQILPASVAAWAQVHGFAMLRVQFPELHNPAAVRLGLRALADGLVAGPAQG